MINIRKFLGLDYYISPLDQFLSDFDKKNSKKSDSQQVEIRKYFRVFKLRDNKNADSGKKSFWDKF
jgi:hypothetical protein